MDSIETKYNLGFIESNIDRFIYESNIYERQIYPNRYHLVFEHPELPDLILDYVVWENTIRLLSVSYQMDHYESPAYDLKYIEESFREVAEIYLLEEEE